MINNIMLSMNRAIVIVYYSSIVNRKVCSNSSIGSIPFIIGVPHFGQNLATSFGEKFALPVWSITILAPFLSATSLTREKSKFLQKSHIKSSPMCLLDASLFKFITHLLNMG